VASHFLNILAADARSARTKVVVATILGLGLFGLAYILAPPWQGVAVHAGALLVGGLVGLLAARSRIRRYEQSIRGTWTQWMRYAVAAETVPEVYRKVRGRSGRNLPILYAAVLTVVWGAEVGLLVLALAAKQDLGLVVVAPVIAFNGLLAGSMVGHFAVMRRWMGTFAASVKELVETGEINVWGLV
jgi:hypothetical protein